MRRRLEHVARQLLGLLDVRLVEGVDAEDDAADGGGDLPADELAPEVDRVGDGDPDDWMAGGLDGVRERVPATVGATIERDADEHPVVPVGTDLAERFEVDRDDPDAVLPGAFGDELFRPRAEG
jgi:hypothetical protein